MTRSFDAIVIGAGQAGPPLAARLVAAGSTVAIVERKLFGGTCVNTGCIPTKTLIASAEAAHMARRAADYGIRVGGDVVVDMAAVKRRMKKVSGDARAGVESWLRGLAGCTVLEGQARFVSPTEIAVEGAGGSERLVASRIFVNVGARAAVPPLPGVHDIDFLTNTSILELDTVPDHLVVVGGSYIGLEFAQMYRRFGAAVTIVEKSARLIPREDTDVSDAVRAILEAEGIAVRVDAECIRFAPRDGRIAVGVECASGEPEVLGSHVLLAVGRRPNTDDLALDAAGVEVDAHGYIVVDDQLRTSAPGIWALGDCNGRGGFTHTSYNDFEIVAANLLDGDARRVTDRVTAYALYVDPPLGRVGLTETEARASGRTVRVGQRPMTRVGRAVEKGETAGFMKVIVDADSDRIVGASILGVGGDEAIHGVLDTMSAGATASTLRRTMHIHPTVSELIPTVLGELAG